MLIILGILFGLLNLIDLEIAGLGEIAFTVILFYYAYIKKHKKINFTNKKILVYIVLFIIYIMFYFLLSRVSKILVLKNLMKWIIIFVQILCIYNCLVKNEKTTLDFMLPYLLISKYIECINVSREWFLHYFILIFLFILLLRHKNKGKYEILLYIVCLFYTFIGKSRIALVLFATLVGYKLIYSFLKDFSSLNKMKQLKNIFVVMMAIVWGIIGINYISNKVTTSTESNNERILLIEIAFEEFKNNMLVGVGPGNYNNYAQNELGYSLRGKELSTHNIYLEILSEYGLIGISIFGMMLVQLIKQLFNAKNNIYSNFLIVHLIVYYLFSTFAGMNRLIFAIFIASSLYYTEKDQNLYLENKNEKN